MRILKAAKSEFESQLCPLIAVWLKALRVSILLSVK